MRVQSDIYELTVETCTIEKHARISDEIESGEGKILEAFDEHCVLTQ